MKQLKEYVNLDKRGSLFYEIPGQISFQEKSELLNEFTNLHADNRSWGVNMHMTKRSMPFAIYGKISFRGRKGYNINKLIVYFDNSLIGNNINEQKLVWDLMKNVESYNKFWKGEYKFNN